MCHTVTSESLSVSRLTSLVRRRLSSRWFHYTLLNIVVYKKTGRVQLRAPRCVFRVRPHPMLPSYVPSDHAMRRRPRRAMRKGRGGQSVGEYHLQSGATRHSVPAHHLPHPLAVALWRRAPPYSRSAPLPPWLNEILSSMCKSEASPRIGKGATRARGWLVGPSPPSARPPRCPYPRPPRPRPPPRPAPAPPPPPPPPLHAPAPAPPPASASSSCFSASSSSSCCWLLMACLAEPPLRRGPCESPCHHPPPPPPPRHHLCPPLPHRLPADRRHLPTRDPCHCLQPTVPWRSRRQLDGCARLGGWSRRHAPCPRATRCRAHRAGGSAHRHVAGSDFDCRDVVHESESESESERSDDRKPLSHFCAEKGHAKVLAALLSVGAAAVDEQDKVTSLLPLLLIARLLAAPPTSLSICQSIHLCGAAPPICIHLHTHIYVYIYLCMY